MYAALFHWSLLWRHNAKAVIVSRNTPERDSYQRPGNANARRTRALLDFSVICRIFLLTPYKGIKCVCVCVCVCVGGGGGGGVKADAPCVQG